ncbi:MAG: ABC transporter ATP-binding protein [Candidatus Dormibacteria bacterium]
MALTATSSAPAAVEVEGISKGFSVRRQGTRWWRPAWRRKVALHHLDLDINAGEITGIIGPNGSGKSTLVRVLSTLLLPDTGCARVFGHDVVKNPHHVRRHINRVSVEAAFFKEMSPWENLGYAARLYGASNRDRRGEVEGVMDRLGLARSALDRPMKQLSRGQQQKVAIARSFLTSPSLLLMDEPTTGLDPRSKREVQAFVDVIRAERAATVLLCTHDLQEAEALCDRILIIDRGRVLADGTAAALRRAHGGGDTTLEDVFMRLTGRDLTEDEESPEEDD